MPAASSATGLCSATGDKSLIGLSLGVCRGRRKGRV